MQSPELRIRKALAPAPPSLPWAVLPSQSIVREADRFVSRSLRCFCDYMLFFWMDLGSPDSQHSTANPDCPSPEAPFQRDIPARQGEATDPCDGQAVLAVKPGEKADLG